MGSAYQRDICTCMFIAALFIRYESDTEENIVQPWNKILPFLAIWRFWISNTICQGPHDKCWNFVCMLSRKCHHVNFSGGKSMEKNRIPVTEPRNDRTQVQLSGPMSFLAYIREEHAWGVTYRELGWFKNSFVTERSYLVRSGGLREAVPWSPAFS